MKKWLARYAQKWAEKNCWMSPDAAIELREKEKRARGEIGKLKCELQIARGHIDALQRERIEADLFLTSAKVMQEILKGSLETDAHLSSLLQQQRQQQMIRLAALNQPAMRNWTELKTLQDQYPTIEGKLGALGMGSCLGL